MEKSKSLEYNLVMKRLGFVIFMCLIFSSACFAEVQTAPQAGMMTEEINSSFSNSKDTKWFIHRIKPKTNKSKLKKSDEKLIKEINNGPNPPKANTSIKTETVHTTKPAEKIINEETKAQQKEEKQRLEQEKEREQYRQLQELTEQYQQAVALYNDNNLDEALASFAKLPEDKRPPEAWLLMGNILMDKGKKDEAVFMYGRAIMTDSNYYKAYYNLGNVYLSDDKFNMAVEQYKTASKYCPANSYIFYNLGCAYIKLGELKKAKNAFIRAIELNNQIADFHYNLAYVYKKLGKEKQAKAFLSNYNKLTGQIN